MPQAQLPALMRSVHPEQLSHPHGQIARQRNSGSSSGQCQARCSGAEQARTKVEKRPLIQGGYRRSLARAAHCDWESQRCIGRESFHFSTRVVFEFQSPRVLSSFLPVFLASTSRRLKRWLETLKEELL
jgi:hypothetical protein